MSLHSGGKEGQVDYMPKAVIYARFSCSKQREASIEDQLRVCRDWCEREGYEVVAEYCDRAASGRTDDRRQFQQMIANAGESDIVLVYMMDRFSRDVYDAPIYKRKLKDKGVRVVSATESMPDGPEAILIESIYEAMAAMESAHIAQRTKRGMEGNAMKCLHNGVKVFGYRFTDDNRYAIDDAEAEIVREIYARHIEGEASHRIAEDLAQRGWRTTWGTRISPHAVDTILKNEKYKGVYKWGETRVEGGMPSIVGEDVWNMAQRAVVRKQRKMEDWSEYALAGRCVCLECGINMVGVSGRGHRNYKYTYYRCSKKCGCRPVRADWLEDAIVSELRSMLSDRESAVEIAKLVAASLTDDDAQLRLDTARKSLADAERGISNLMRAVESGMEWDDVSDRMAELKEQRMRAKADIVAWSEVRTLDVEDFADFLQRGATLNDRDLIDAFVWQVGVTSDDVVVVLNYDVKENEPARIEFLREFEQKDFGSPAVFSFERKALAKVVCLRGCVAIFFPREPKKR